MIKVLCITYVRYSLVEKLQLLLVRENHRFNRFCDNRNNRRYIRFGDLLAVNAAGTAYNSTRGIHAGGVPSGSSRSNIIQYITIATLGNAQDFGDLNRS